MHDVVVEGKILAWGNSYGVRIRKEDLERAGLAAGAEVKVRIETGGGKIDLSGLPVFHGGDPRDSERHDELLAEARFADLERKRVRGDRHARR